MLYLPFFDELIQFRETARATFIAFRLPLAASCSVDGIAFQKENSSEEKKQQRRYTF